ENDCSAGFHGYWPRMLRNSFSPQFKSSSGRQGKQERGTGGGGKSRAENWPERGGGAGMISRYFPDISGACRCKSRCFLSQQRPETKPGTCLMDVDPERHVVDATAHS